MRRGPVWIFALLMVGAFAPARAGAGEKGHIQVKCEPGVQVLLDGLFQGVTAADVGGLILPDVAAGAHRLKAVKAGCAPQEAGVTVEAGRVAVQEFAHFIPKVEIVEEGPATAVAPPRLGSIEIVGAPAAFTVDIPDLGVDRRPKTQEKMIVKGVPPGRYAARFTAAGKTLSHTATVAAGARVRLTVDFAGGKVSEAVVAGPPEAAAARKRQEEAAKALGLAVEKQVDLGGGVKMAMVFIPAGEFEMGSPEDEPKRDDDEQLHHVAIRDSFYLGKFEVTQQQWAAIMARNPSHFNGAKNPVDSVSWSNCQRFLERLNERVPGVGFALPTEAQWEYACRAGAKTAFYFGDDEAELGDHGWYAMNSENSTHPVGEKRPNPWGLYDLYGNVWEWTSSPWMNPYDGSELKGAAADGAVRVLRGASWMNSAGALRSAQRASYGWTFCFDIFGFRLACPARK